ncbi:hypothetical protein NFI96_012136, partial [Prochilodus magdalenae]
MAATVEELYRNYGILADAKEDLSQHKDAYQVILDGVKGGPKEKRLAAQFIPKFFSSFPELADAAINAQLDLCEDEDVSIRRQAIKELPRFAAGENLPRVADILTQLLQTDDSAEFNQVNSALISIFKIDAKGTLGGLFSQILQGEDVVRERAIKFLSTKLKTMPEDTMTKEVEDYIFIETKKVLEDVTGEEFVLLMRVLSALKYLQTVSGRQQLVELVVEQAFLEQALNPADTDSVDRLLQCTRQALPLFSKNVHSTRFVTYFCEHVLPNLSMLTSPVAELDIQLEVLKLLAEMSPYCGDMDKLEPNLMMLFEKLLEFMPLPPEEENGENAVSEEPKLQFSYVECLLFSFHQLGKKLPDFLIDKINAEKLKDFKIRQYFARGLQVYIRQLRVALQGKTGDALKTEENKIKVVALKITNNINVLIKDLFHNPPSYKSTVTLSWKPVQKTEVAAAAAVVGQKRPSAEDTGTGTLGKKVSPLPRRDARQIYNPPSGKYSATIGNFSYVLQLTWVSVTINTMVRYLDPKEVAQAQRPVVGPVLTGQHRRARLAFATEHQNWQIRHRRLVLFTDESRFYLTGSGDAMENVMPPATSFSMTGLVDEILGPVVRPYAGAVGPGFLLVHNNAQPHVARVCRQFLENEEIDTIDCPTGSPDLNPIEHLWDIMFRYIRHHHVALQTVQELSDAQVQIWEEIPQDNI